MNSAKVVGFAAGISLTCIWASWTIITRLGLKTDLLIFDLFALRLLVATLLVAPFIVYTKFWRGLTWKQYFILGFLGGSPHTLTAYAALERTSVAHFSIFLYGMTPVLTAIAAYIVVKKKVDKSQLSGALLILLGVLALSIDSFTTGMSRGVWLGNGIAIFSTALFAGYLVFAERWNITISQSLMACTVLNGIIYLPIWAYFRASAILQVDLSELLIQGGFQGVIPGVLSFYVMTLATQKIGANMTSLFFALIPIASAGLAVIVLNEVLTRNILAGLLVTTFGIVVCSINWRTLRAKKKIAQCPLYLKDYGQ
ncbi:MAG: DMT family transporter [Motiliproteus sp.]